MGAALTAVAAVAIWTYLLLGRGFFWQAAERDDSPDNRGRPERWPNVGVVIPARNEAEIIGRTLISLIRQTYPGGFSILLVDDQSSDGTAEVARAAARNAGDAGALTLLRGEEPPRGWTGKVWAMHQGFQHLQRQTEPPEYVLFTDADIAYRAPDAVERLVTIALARGTVLTSLMVKLRCESTPERMLVPAFIFFFAKLYPFGWVNDPRRATAAAAGGCMLVKRQALTAAGGLEAIRGALIDDCALGAMMKRQGPIWLGLTERVRSLRAYARLRDIRRMVVRSAYAELKYSPVRLAGTVAGMALTYLAPPLLALFADGAARTLGAAAWVMMAFAFVPTLRFYGRNPAWGLALPLIAAIYTAFTLESAVEHWRGRGGAWKGRFQADAAAPGERAAGA